MYKARDYKIGERVIHKNHGAGRVFSYSLSDDELVVEFDVQPKGWDRVLCVSVGCLRLEHPPLKYYFTGYCGRRITRTKEKDGAAAWKEIDKILLLTRAEFLQRYSSATSEDFDCLRAVIAKA